MEDMPPGCIMAPKLEHLYFAENTANYWDLIPIMQIFCINGVPFGSTSLRQLTIQKAEVGPEIISYMRQLDNLQTLKFVSCKLWKASFAPLWTSSSEHTSLFLPSLAPLRMESAEVDDRFGDFAEIREKCAAARPSLELIIW
jgi:hypothetical protein